MKRPRINFTIHFKNPGIKPIKGQASGTLSEAGTAVRKTVGFPEDTGRDLLFVTIWGKRIVVAAYEILYVELEEA